MTSRATTIAVRQIFTNATQLGATIPQRILDEHAKLTDLADKTRHLSHELVTDVSSAVLDAIAAGNDPTTDERVRSAVTAREIAQHENGIDAALGARVGAFVEDNAEDILSMFAEPFDQAAAVVVEAHHLFGDVDLDDTRTILAKGGDAAAKWAALQAAEQELTLVRNSYSLLGQAASRYAISPRYRLLSYAEVPAFDFHEQRLANVQLTAWEVVRRGFTLSLATPDEARARIEGILDHTKQVQAARDNAHREQVQVHYGFQPVR